MRRTVRRARCTLRTAREGAEGTCWDEPLQVWVAAMRNALSLKGMYDRQSVVRTHWAYLLLVLLLLHTFSGLFSRTTFVSDIAIFVLKRDVKLQLTNSRTTWISYDQKDKPFWILLEQEMMGCSGISGTDCKSFAPRSRQIATPAPHHSIFYRPDALPDAQPTVSKH